MSVRLVPAIALAAILGGAGRADAAAFNVTPTQVALSTKIKSAMLGIRNQSAEAVRFQLSVFAWDQDPRGEMKLTPTQDIVFFPTLFQLAPGEERQIRVGTNLPGAPLERSYRIFVEELPPATKLKDARAGKSDVRVLTRVGVPIFVAPAGAAGGPTGRVEPKALHGARVSFEVKNTGNVHFTVKSARVLGRGAGKESLFERTVPGWYVLAGGSRVFEIEPPKGVCAKTRELAFRVETDKTTFEAELPTQSGICGP